MILTIISIIFGIIALLAAINIVREETNYLMAFLAGGVVILLPGIVMSFLYLPVPYYPIILSAIIWILAVKLLLRLSWKNSLIVGILGYIINFAINILGLPGLVAMLVHL